MTFAEAIVSARGATDHVTDTQVTDTQIARFLNDARLSLLRRLSLVVPSLYTAISSPVTLTTGGLTYLSSPADMDRILRVERRSTDGVNWYPVSASDELNHDGLGDVWSWPGDLNWREEGATIQLAPPNCAPGTYRIVYVTVGADISGGTALGVPTGCENIIVQEACAQIREALDEDPAPHMARAAALWVEMKRELRRRYGQHVKPGLRRTRGW